ncbi:hypothetical protein ACFE04_020773 [Oxalis oulophora]
MSLDETQCSSVWTRNDDKAFENALATYDEDDLDLWEKIAADVPGKTLEDIKEHYELLVEDVNRIESGCVPLPKYKSSSENSTGLAGDEAPRKKGAHYNNESNHGGKASRSDQERRKGIAWTEDEHRIPEFVKFQSARVGFLLLFLLGLDKYGKGDWRSISRNFVVTRTPTQVASHAQKYFIRLNSMNKDRRRSSIHDITSVGDGDMSAPQGPITGQTNGSAVVGGPSVKSGKQLPQHPTRSPVIGMYGPPAVGTPVNLSASGAHMAYGVRAPVAGAQMNMGPMTYPMQHATTNQ